ncbi:MAG: hypothetical protein AB2993_03865 [Candidatus Symbiodolus clandestinus]
MDHNKTTKETELTAARKSSQQARKDFCRRFIVQDNLSDARSVIRKDPALIDSPDASGENMLNCSIRKGDTLLTHGLIKLGANVNAVNGNNHTPLQTAVNAGNAKLVEILRENKAVIRVTDDRQNFKKFRLVTASSSESSISCADSDNQLLAASPLTPRDGKREAVVLQEANQSPDIKLGGKSTPVPKLSLRSINPNNRLEESNKTYADSSQPSLGFRALATSRSLHNLPENPLPFGKSQSFAVEPEKKFPIKHYLKGVINNIEEPHREQYSNTHEEYGVAISRLRERLMIEKPLASRHPSNESSTASLTSFDSTVTGDDHSTLPLLSSIDSSVSDKTPSLFCRLKNTENLIRLEDHQGDDAKPDSPNQPPVNHLELPLAFAADKLAASVASSTNAAETGCEISSPAVELQVCCCPSFFSHRSSKLKPS